MEATDAEFESYDNIERSSGLHFFVDTIEVTFIQGNSTCHKSLRMKASLLLALIQYLALF